MRALGIVLFSLLLSACSTLPRDVERPVSHAVANTGDTRLGHMIRQAATAHPGQSGFHALSDGVEALLSRLVLAELAERTLDVQYYIWHHDQTGRYFAQAMLEAADRGVRVRILLDDLGVNPDDEVLLALEAHPQIEIRLFNPVASRRFRGLSAIADFSRVNRRMHNKAFIADNQAAILGGRNIGDEYFNAAGDVAFHDLDVLTVGEGVPAVSQSFDAYWNSELAYPVRALGIGSAEELAALRAGLNARVKAESSGPYAMQARKTLAEHMASGKIPFDWGRARLLYDDPQKVLRPAGDPEGTLLPQFSELGLQAKQSLMIVSPYFVPGKVGVNWLGELVERGVEVTVLTNSLAATDVSAVHAGYSRYRRDLLEVGVHLYELKADADRRKKGGADGKSGSRASLHAKTFIFDKRTVFIGSMNLDPRSVVLNTEIGLLCESEALAERLSRGLVSGLKAGAYRVELSTTKEADAGTEVRGETSLVWSATEPEGPVSYSSDPEAGVWRRFSVWVMRLLPIESQL